MTDNKKMIILVASAVVLIVAITFAFYNRTPLATPQTNSLGSTVPQSFVESVEKSSSSTILRTLLEEFNAVTLETASTTEATSTPPEPNFDQSLSAQL